MGEDQKGTSEDPKGIREGVEGSKGDLRVVLLLNAVLSGMFAWTAFWGYNCSTSPRSPRPTSRPSR